MIQPKQKIKVLIMSDGTGETATAMTRAALSQFPDKEVFFTRYKNVRDEEHIQNILQEAQLHHDLLVYTIASRELRKYIAEQARQKTMRAIDLLGPLLNNIANLFEMEPDYQPGLLRQVNDKYYKKVEAIEFTLNHDDGKNLQSLQEADIVLVGISRTSKTPLSIYLSLEGLKVVNVPLVQSIGVPQVLFEIDQRKIFALTIDPNHLEQIRKNRLLNLGTHESGDYANSQKVIDEVNWANQIFSQNKRWPVFDVTDKALEETAAEIMKLLSMRSQNRFKHSKRF